MKTYTSTELKAILAVQNTAVKTLKSLKGCAIVGISSETTVKLLGGKKNPMLNRVTKVMDVGNVMVFCNKKSNGYENMVSRRLEKEGKEKSSFKLGRRVWGERVENTPFIEHKGSIYLETIFLSTPKVKYLLDGEPIDKQDIEGLKVKPVEGKQGGLENKVIIRTFKTDSLTKIRWNGKETTL